MAHVCLATVSGESDSDVASAAFRKAFQVDVAGVGKVFEVFTQYRISHFQHVSQMGEFDPLDRGEVRTDPQPGRGVDQLIKLGISGGSHVLP